MTMAEKPNDVLLLAGKVLAIFMQGFSALAGVLMIILVPLMLFLQGAIAAELIEQGTDLGAEFPASTITGLFVLIAVVAAAAFVFFGKLRAMISTVGDGDPFAPENAERLNLMAWLLLAIEILFIPIAGLGLMLAKRADEAEHADVTIDVGLDPTGLLMIIVLFILARVFKHGARMRDDLEGTV